MPPNQRLRTNDLQNLQYRRKPAIQLDEEPPVPIGHGDPAPPLTPQNEQLISERRNLGLEPRLRSERQAQERQNEPEKSDHPLSLRDSLPSSIG
jgi:hypothetical protein